MARSRSPFVAASLLPVFAAALPAQLTSGDAGTPLPPRDASFAFFDQPRGRVTVCGGTGGGVHLDDCWQLDDGAWLQVPVVPGTALAYGACCEDPARFGAAVLFGGLTGNGTVSALTRRWNRQTMRLDTLSPATSPPARWVSAMALDTNRGRAVLFGGGASWWFGDTWEWDGNNWQQRFPTQSPPIRSHHAMAFDAARGRVVLFGGHNGASLADTWTYDGTTWTQMTGPGPGALHDAMLAYDASRSVVVKFGGKTDAGVVNDQVWEWNGSTWAQKSPAGPRPPARELGALVYDAQRRVVTLAGGIAGSTAFGDAWHWNGTAWTEAKPRDRGTLVGPSDRYDAALGYDATNDKYVLFGGISLAGGQYVPLNDTWERAGEVWQRRTPAVSPPAGAASVGTTLRGTGTLCYVTGNAQWVFGSNGEWSSVPLNTPPLSGWTVMASLLSSQLGWVLVRLVTASDVQSSTLQLIVPNTGVVQTMFLTGGPLPLIGGSMAQSSTATVEPNRVWLFGGMSFSGGVFTCHNDLWELADTGIGGNLAWTLVVPEAGSPVPPVRRWAATAYYDSGGGTTGIVVSGGLSGTNQEMDDCWFFQLSPGPGYHRWVEKSSTIVPRIRGATTSARVGTAASSLVTVGGRRASVLVTLDDTCEYRGSAMRAAAVWTRPAPRVGATLAYDRGTQRSLLFSGDLQRNDLWSYDGATWTPVVPIGPVPRGRLRAVACFDEANAAMVLFGGVSGTHFADTWALFANGQWSQRATGPAARQGAAMVYVASQQRCLMFGGATTNSPSPPTVHGDTWLYDTAGNQWSQGPPGPSGRHQHAMAYDRRRECVVLFGGQSSQSSASLDDTWEYGAATGWQPRQPAHRPPGRQGHTMIYDEARARVVLSGGARSQGGGSPTWLDASTEIWEWDGSDWVQRTPDTVVLGRVGAAAAYDAARGRAVSFGGAQQQWNVDSAVYAGITDDLFELHARVDVAGRGNTVVPEGLRFYSQPVLGEPLHLGFTNPNGVAWGLLGFGPVQQPLGTYPGCEPGAWYASGASSWYVTGAVEPNWTLTVPNVPQFVGQTLVLQAFVLQQPGSCWRLTDALHARY